MPNSKKESKNNGKELVLENYKKLPVSMMVEADWNYKEDNPFLHQRLMENFKRNGQIENIIVRELDTGFYEVVNGNHRLKVLKELGWEYAYVYDLGKISLQQAQRIAIETNESRFQNDIFKLADVLKEIMTEYKQEDLLTTLPYTETEFNNLLDLSETEFKPEMPVGIDDEKKSNDEPEYIVCPHCGGLIDINNPDKVVEREE